MTSRTITARRPETVCDFEAQVPRHVIPPVDEIGTRSAPVQGKRQAERWAGGTVSPVAGTTSVLAAGGGHADAVVP